MVCPYAVRTDLTLQKSVELGTLSPDDPLGRYITSESRARKAQNTGKIAYDVFQEKIERDSLSVDRLDLASDREMAEIADRNAAVSGRPFFGWVVVSVHQASQMGRQVEPTPFLDNRYHADIHLNLPNGSERRDVRTQHALNLAKQAVYRLWRQLPARR